MMDSQSQEIFDAILTKDQDSLSTEEVDFLMARRGYLNDEQRKRYAGLISAHEKAVKSGALGKSEDGLDEMTVKALEALAKKEQVVIKGLTTKPDIVTAIRTARKNAEQE